MRATFISNFTSYLLSLSWVDPIANYTHQSSGTSWPSQGQLLASTMHVDPTTKVLNRNNAIFFYFLQNVIQFDLNVIYFNQYNIVSLSTNMFN